MNNNITTPKNCSHKKWRDATITLSVFFTLSILIIAVFSVLTAIETNVVLKVTKAVKGASTNKNMCNTPGVICNFTPSPNTPPPAPSPIGNTYSPSAAAFAAQVVATLEQAMHDGVNPVALPQTTQLALLSGDNDTNIGWILETVDSTQLWIAFRGTQTSTEWKQDFTVKQVPWDSNNNNVLVHSGFYTLYNSLKPQIMSIISNLSVVPEYIYICGHSLGAALAVLCTADLASSFTTSSINTYVFAPPRVGNTAFITMVKEMIPAPNLYLLANTSDIVPDLPLPVQPNISQHDSPWMYDQFPLMTFNTNWGSWELNHMMPVYIAYVETQLTTK